MTRDYRHKKTTVRAVIADTPYLESDETYDVVICHYTKALFSRNEGIILGAVVPQVSISYLCHPFATEARKSSVKAFNSFEKNCNTCKHLTRVPFVKDASGLHPGKCGNGNRKPLYPRGGENIMFAPEDCMLQDCYEER